MNETDITKKAFESHINAREIEGLCFQCYENESHPPTIKTKFEIVAKLNHVITVSDPHICLS